MAMHELLTPTDIDSVKFTTMPFGEWYDCREVDDFLDECYNTLNRMDITLQQTEYADSDMLAKCITPQKVQNVEFDCKELNIKLLNFSNSYYKASQVDEFLDDVSYSIATYALLLHKAYDKVMQ